MSNTGDGWCYRPCKLVLHPFPIMPASQTHPHLKAGTYQLITSGKELESALCWCNPLRESLKTASHDWIGL
ncbi:MAG: hypothetical protein HC780_00090 [Leptolyngbyaceae cyanobacterium CSU_1_3]|nr:hypothetical protein [Leptolyngbyaceae cyanobacterium CSU_1_3]